MAIITAEMNHPSSRDSLLGMLVLLSPLPFALVPPFCVLVTLIGFARSSTALARCSMVLLFVHLFPKAFLFAIFTPALVPPTFLGILVAITVWWEIPNTLLFIILGVYRSRFLSTKGARAALSFSHWINPGPLMSETGTTPLYLDQSSNQASHEERPH
jgi:hypothetical protein